MKDALKAALLVSVPLSFMLGWGAYVMTHFKPNYLTIPLLVGPVAFVIIFAFAYVMNRD